MRVLGGPLAVAALCGLSAGCVGKTEASSASGSSTGGSAGASETSTSGSASGASSAGTGTSSGSGSGSASSSSSSGTTTGHIPVFVDGGYVFCAADLDIDGGEVTERWLCQPGTYFCGDPDACAQCRSDDDCGNQDLPTYDPLRQRCDLDSGVAGYWGFCEQCIGNADCAGNAIANQCDLNPSSVEPSIETQGFETCANLGPGCPFGTVPGIGGCVESKCETDADCAGAISVLVPGLGLLAQEAEPYCIGGQCGPFPPSLPSYLCPNCFCDHDTTCYDGISTCDEAIDHCGCTSSAQCGGPWPICELSDAGYADDAGDLIGFCGCESDADCGDAGLKCVDLQPNDTLNLYGGKTCLFACTDPRFPGCTDLSPNTPICDAPSGLCIACETDQQCRTQATGTSLGPFCRLDGQCGCQADKDCPDHEVCRGQSSRSSAGGTIFQCLPPMLACTPESCQPGACDSDSGVCAVAASGQPICFSDFDCGAGAFCDPDAGGCVECRDNADCVTIGAAARSNGICSYGECTAGCVSDTDCAASYNGHTCDTDSSSSSFGACICRSSSECSLAEACVSTAGRPAQCESCQANADCESGLFCTPFGMCQPRCDDGGSGCEVPFPLCDTSNVYGENGQGISTPVPGAVWCYACLSASDCPSDLACNGYACTRYCFDSSQCHPGEVCGDEFDYTCHASCDAGSCPNGQVCDLQEMVIPIPDLCYECLSPTDCQNGTGCNSSTHTCGSCRGPSASGGPFDCPADSICSNYWERNQGVSGVCLQNCDHVSCDDPTKTCAVFQDLTPFHQYCFGCLQDSDCADAGPGAWCDTSVDLTFTCKPRGAR